LKEPDVNKQIFTALVTISATASGGVTYRPSHPGSFIETAAASTPSITFTAAEALIDGADTAGHWAGSAILRIRDLGAHAVKTVQKAVIKAAA
jgi:hypothetical protein